MVGNAEVDMFDYLIMVVVEPESSRTFNKILDLTEESVSTTRIVTGVRCF